MKSTMKCYDGDVTVEYNDSEQTKEKLFNTMLEFFKEHDCYCSESYMQCDAPQIAVDEMMEEIIEEVFAFEAEWDD